jgi:predicted TIM-barrel fold metal-dependent hydrolase
MLMAHFGNPWWDEAWKIAWAHPNIYADLSGGTAYRRSMMLWRELFAPDGNLHSASFEKLCFGSDTTYFRQGNYGFQPYIDFYERLYEAVGAPDELREKVNIRNIQKLFRIL